MKVVCETLPTLLRHHKFKAATYIPLSWIIPPCVCVCMCVTLHLKCLNMLTQLVKESTRNTICMHHASRHQMSSITDVLGARERNLEHLARKLPQIGNTSGIQQSATIPALTPTRQEAIHQSLNPEPQLSISQMKQPAQLPPLLTNCTLGETDHTCLNPTLSTFPSSVLLSPTFPTDDLGFYQDNEGYIKNNSAVKLTVELSHPRKKIEIENHDKASPSTKRLLQCTNYPKNATNFWWRGGIHGNKDPSWGIFIKYYIVWLFLTKCLDHCSIQLHMQYELLILLHNNGSLCTY